MRNTKRKSRDLREWCDGWPLMATRTLTVDERKCLRREFLLLRLRGCAVLGLFPIAFFIAMLLLVIAEPRNQGSLPFAYSALLFIFVCVYGFLAVVRLEGYQRSKLLRGDLKIGDVKQYGKVEAVPVAAELSENPSEPAGGEHSAVEFEVLASSRRLWTVSGIRAKKWEITQPSAVADTPAFAAIASDWLQPVARTSNELVESGQRELSPGECEEIRLIARSTWRKRFWPCFLTSVWFYSVAVLCVSSRRLPEGNWNRIEFAFLGLVTLAWNGIFIQALLRSIALKRDASAKVVIIGRIREVKPQNNEHSTFDFEMLPFSKLYWTQGLQPAEWRTKRLSV